MTKADTKNEADIQLPRGSSPKVAWLDCGGYWERLPRGIGDPENGS
jgi:hypothetical protein